MQIVQWKRFALLALLCFCLPAFAQKIELGVLGGGHVPIGSTLDINPGTAIEGVFAYRLASVPFVALYSEVPVVVGFRLTASTPFSSADYSALYLTPGLKLKLAPGFPISPYFAVGGGYARFKASNPLLGSTTSNTSNQAVVDFGGGLDVKVFPFVSLRGEVRDFRTSTFNLLNLTGLGGHNLVGAGGLVLRF